MASTPPSPSSESDDSVQESIRYAEKAHRRNANNKWWYMVLGAVLAVAVAVAVAVAFGAHRAADTTHNEGRKALIEGRNRLAPETETNQLLDALGEMKKWHVDWRNRTKDVAGAATDNVQLRNAKVSINDGLSNVIITVMTGETICGDVSAIYSALELATALLPLDAHQAVTTLANVLGVMRDKLQKSIIPKIDDIATNPRYQALHGNLQVELSALQQYMAELQAQRDILATSHVWRAFAFFDALSGSIFSFNAKLAHAEKELQQAGALVAEMDKLLPIVDSGSTLDAYGTFLNGHLLPDVLNQDFSGAWVDVAALKRWAKEPHLVPRGSAGVYDRVVTDMMILLGQMDRYDIREFCSAGGTDENEPRNSGARS